MWLRSQYLWQRDTGLARHNIDIIVTITVSEDEWMFSERGVDSCPFQVVDAPSMSLSLQVIIEIWAFSNKQQQVLRNHPPLHWTSRQFSIYNCAQEISTDIVACSEDYSDMAQLLLPMNDDRHG